MEGPQEPNAAYRSTVIQSLPDVYVIFLNRVDHEDAAGIDIVGEFDSKEMLGAKISATYQLASVIYHIDDSLKGGYFQTRFRNEGLWYLATGDVIQPSDDPTVVGEGERSCILVYEKVN
jgi:hypothetical protein